MDEQQVFNQSQTPVSSGQTSQSSQPSQPSQTSQFASPDQQPYSDFTNPPSYEPSQPPTPEPSQPPTPEPNLSPAPDNMSSSSSSQSQPLPDYLKPMEEEVVFEWVSPSRPFKQRNRRYFTTVVTISLLVSMILFFAGQFLPIAVVVAVAFLAYVMATIPPHNVTQQITNYGIRIEDQLYYWEEFGWFWFSRKFDDMLLNVEVERFPNRLSMVLGEAKMSDLRELLSQVLVEQTPPPTFYEKAARWLEEKIPLDID